MAKELPPSGQDRRDKLDQCQIGLIRVKAELRSLAFLFEHLKGSECCADDLTGISVTLARIAANVSKAIKAVNGAY
jgi:hypothetical protein